LFTDNNIADDYAVTAKSLTKNFNGRKAVDSLTINVRKGTIYGLIGPDGAGKTSALRMIAGLLTPDSGESFVCGLSSQKSSSLVKDRLAYMSQKFGLYEDLTVYENIRLYADLYGVPKAEMKSSIDSLLRFSYMHPFAKRRAGKLSGGMKQKLQLICALIHKPEVLLLDEPTNGVDPVSRRDFWRILYKLASDGVTIIVTTAYLDEAERCGVIGLMHEGRIIAEGEPHTVIAESGHKTLEQIFIALSQSTDRSHLLHLVSNGVERKSGSSVTTEKLTKKFGSFTAVNAINLDVKYGEIYGFLGPNGAGKSTAIKMLCGLLPPTSGRGTVAGQDVGGSPEKIKMSIGYMSQKFSLYEDLRILENINFYGGVYGLSGKKLDVRRDWALELSGLTDRKKELTSNLTGGWRQRLALACAVLHLPSIVFLDEPTSGADPASRQLFWQIIRALAESGVTVFVSTHYMDEAEYCDRMSMIFRGNMIAQGSPAELKQNAIKEKIISVRISEPQRYIDDLSAVTGETTALFGAGMHIRTYDTDDTLMKVNNFFTSRNASFKAELVPPSMEDVFVSLIDNAGGDDE
jgi:ABC-2 type transport system ATP-binding protein